MGPELVGHSEELISFPFLGDLEDLQPATDEERLVGETDEDERRTS